MRLPGIRLSRPREIRLLLPCPKPRPDRIWGDFYFARSLAGALTRLGFRTRLGFAPERNETRRQRLARLSCRPFGIDIVIRGRRPCQPTPTRPQFMWLISSPDTLGDDELQQARHIFVASRQYCAHLIGQGLSASFLPQCTDRALFSPARYSSDFTSDLLFVGNRRAHATRDVVETVVAAGLPLEVWGRGWAGVLPEGVHRGDHISNDALGVHYASARAVLNDHTPDMFQHGFLSNRVYDVLASGTRLVTEQMDDLPGEGLDLITAYAPGQAPEAARSALGAVPARPAEVAAEIAARHSFDVRAADLAAFIFGRSPHLPDNPRPEREPQALAPRARSPHG